MSYHDHSDEARTVFYQIAEILNNTGMTAQEKRALLQERHGFDLKLLDELVPLNDPSDY